MGVLIYALQPGLTLKKIVEPGIKTKGKTIKITIKYTVQKIYP